MMESGLAGSSFVFEMMLGILPLLGDELLSYRRWVGIGVVLHDWSSSRLLFDYQKNQTLLIAPRCPPAGSYLCRVN